VKFSRIFLPLCLLFVCGCTSTQGAAGNAMPGLTFSHLKTIPISVGAIKTNESESPFSESFVASPYQAFDDYIHARFAPSGFAGFLSAKVEAATISHSYQAANSDVGRFFNVAGMDVYDMTLKVRLEHLNMDGQMVRGDVLTARRIVRVSEHTSIADREKAQLDALEAMFSDLDSEVLRVVLADMDLKG
jgi:hypothetical protein